MALGSRLQVRGKGGGLQRCSAGFTLMEVLLGGMVLAVAISAILGAYIGQVTLNEHARNLSLAINDASRVVEQIRQRNSPCAGATPSSNFPAWTAANPTCTGAAPTTSWDDWLQRCDGGKSVPPTPLSNERILLTCQNVAGTAACGASEDPLRLTVAVCWRHRGRTIGECTPAGALVQSDLDGDGVFESPAMLTTLVTCR